MDVLIVDDNPLARRVVRALFESDSNFSVCGEAENGLEGLEQAVELHPGLIIMDLSMPVMNGLDAAREINRAMPSVAIILFTAHSNLQKLELLLSAGICSIVDKADPAMLIDVARDLHGRNAA
jgi:two-component system nitrate/nitrite response regulator NarL